MKISLQTEGLLNPEILRAFTTAKRQKLVNAVGAGMREVGPQLRDAARANVAASLRVRRKTLPNAITLKVYDRDKSRLPAMSVGSRLAILAAHENGGVISPVGKVLLIPFSNQRRLGPMRFRNIVIALMASGNAYFRTVRGTLILFAKNVKENDPQLSTFKRHERQLTGQKRLKRGQDIPIATAVPSVTLKKRLNVKGVIIAGLPALARAIEDKAGDAQWP